MCAYLLADLGVHAQLVGAREGAAAAAAREGPLARVRQLVPRQVRRALEPDHKRVLVRDKTYTIIGGIQCKSYGHLGQRVLHAKSTL